jgi:hypothetical protein
MATKGAVSTKESRGPDQPVQNVLWNAAKRCGFLKERHRLRALLIPKNQLLMALIGSTQGQALIR